MTNARNKLVEASNSLVNHNSLRPEVQEQELEAKDLESDLPEEVSSPGKTPETSKKLIEALVLNYAIEDSTIMKMVKDKLKKSQKDKINSNRKGLRILTGKKIKKTPASGIKIKSCGPETTPTASSETLTTSSSTGTLSKIFEEDCDKEKQEYSQGEQQISKPGGERDYFRSRSLPLVTPISDNVKTPHSAMASGRKNSNGLQLNFQLDNKEGNQAAKSLDQVIIDLSELRSSQPKMSETWEESEERFFRNRKSSIGSQNEVSGVDLSPIRNPLYPRIRSESLSSIDQLGMRKTRRSSVVEMMKKNSISLPSPPSYESAGFRLPHGISSSTINCQPPQIPKKNSSDDFFVACLSALYAKIVIIFGMAFPVAEAITGSIPPVYYTIFLVYLYAGSIFFLVFTYIFMLRTNTINVLKVIKKPFKQLGSGSTMESSDRNPKPPKYSVSNEAAHHGSMYLKAGAVAFGIGSMIYSGLRFGEAFNLNPLCSDNFNAVSSLLRMIFTFLQMYFIFLNSSVAFNKHTVIARFGLMHMVATNLCIWLHILVKETQHEIYVLQQKAGSGYFGPSFMNYDGESNESSESSEEAYDYSSEEEEVVHQITRRAAPEVSNYLLQNCSRSFLMKDALESAAPFLYPCAIEYSLMCAGVMFIMWKGISKPSRNFDDCASEVSTFIARKARHLYSVDCARASRGLFFGIFVLVLTIISIILFYILLNSEEYMEEAIIEADIVEIVIYSMAIFAVLFGMKKMRELHVVHHEETGLDNMLLLLAQTGVYIYCVFSLIADYFDVGFSRRHKMLHFVSILLNFIQTIFQSMFILDGSRRCCYTPEQEQKKPGREMVTFLLICNLAMWAISTFETSRADIHPTQLKFYGIYTWSILSRLFMPLAIFYRFHVSVCLGSIWKSAYKLKQIHAEY